jgi:hypothetical protein
LSHFCPAIFGGSRHDNAAYRSVDVTSKISFAVIADEPWDRPGTATYKFVSTASQNEERSLLRRALAFSTSCCRARCSRCLGKYQGVEGDAAASTARAVRRSVSPDLPFLQPVLNFISTNAGVIRENQAQRPHSSNRELSTRATNERTGDRNDPPQDGFKAGPQSAHVMTSQSLVGRSGRAAPWLPIGR